MKEEIIKIGQIEGHLLTPRNHKGTIVFAHGLLANSEHHLVFNASRQFAEAGYQTFRYDMHTYGESLIDLSKNLSNVVNHFDGNTSIVSHSIGSYVTLFANLKETKNFIFWEPSMNPNLMFRNLTNYKFKYPGYESVLSSRFLLNFPSEETAKNIANKLPNRKLVVEANSNKYSKAKEFFNAVSEEKDLLTISGDHNFNNTKDESDLFEITIKWLNKK